MSVPTGRLGGATEVPGAATGANAETPWACLEIPTLPHRQWVDAGHTGTRRQQPVARLDEGVQARGCDLLFGSGLAIKAARSAGTPGSGPDSNCGQVLQLAAGGTTDVLGDLAATGCVRVEHWWAIRGRPSIAPFGERDDDGPSSRPLSVSRYSWSSGFSE